MMWLAIAWLVCAGFVLDLVHKAPHIEGGD